jgi:hypothetical protein
VRRVRSSTGRVVLGAVVVVVVATLVAVGLLTRSSDRGTGGSSAPGQQPPRSTGACREPGAGPGGPPGGQAPQANVTVGAASEIDTRGLVPIGIAAGDGATWAVVRDPTHSTETPEAIVARVDPSAGAFTTVTPVATGCYASALTVGDGGVWVGTCDELAPAEATAGGQVVRVDPVTGQVTRRVPLPTRCVGQLAVGKDAVAVSEPATAGRPQRVWRVDPGNGGVNQIDSLGGDTSVGGIAVTDGGVWTQEVTPRGDHARRVNPSNGQSEGTVNENDAALVGGHGNAVWFERAQPASIAQRDATSGDVRTETPVANVQSSVVGASGAWFQQATRDSLTITIGRVDPATGAVGPTFSFQGVGPDRSGLPFLGVLAADDDDVWLIYQGRLFRFTAAGLTTESAPTTTSPPPTSEPPTTTTAPQTTTSDTTSPATTATSTP